MGGRGSQGTTVNVSPLTAFKENASQFNRALQKARDNRASVLEYVGITGKVEKRYWNGATFTDRAASLYTKDRTGTVRVKFKKPKSWK